MTPTFPRIEVSGHAGVIHLAAIVEDGEPPAYDDAWGASLEARLDEAVMWANVRGFELTSDEPDDTIPTHEGSPGDVFILTPV